MMVYACIREPTVERGQEMGGGEDGEWHATKVPGQMLVRAVPIVTFVLLLVAVVVTGCNGGSQMKEYN